MREYTPLIRVSGSPFLVILKPYLGARRVKDVLDLQAEDLRAPIAYAARTLDYAVLVTS